MFAEKKLDSNEEVITETEAYFTINTLAKQLNIESEVEFVHSESLDTCCHLFGTSFRIDSKKMTNLMSKRA